jgi:putative transposase
VLTHGPRADPHDPRGIIQVNMMPHDNHSEQHQRRSPRLHGYDYAQAGAYFVTICTQERQPCFGSVVDGLVHLTSAGQMVQETWAELPNHYSGIELDTFIVMPDHLHAIIVLLDQHNQLSLPDTMHRFKSLTTARYRHGVATNEWTPFPGRLWQRSYHDHIIRSEDVLDRIRTYISENPARYSQKSSASASAGI